MSRFLVSYAFLAAVFLLLAAFPVAAQMEVRPGQPVDPNATPDSPLNPRRSLLHPQPVLPDPVRPDMRIPPTPHPEALRPGRPAQPPGFTITEKPPANPQRMPVEGALSLPRQVSQALAACWKPPSLPVQQEITVRLAFNRDGRLIGEPRITYVGGALGAAHRESLRNSILAGISACLPLRFTPGLASAIAGRPFAIRFIAPASKPAGPSI